MQKSKYFIEAEKEVIEKFKSQNAVIRAAIEAAIQRNEEGKNEDSTKAGTDIEMKFRTSSLYAKLHLQS